MPVKDRVEALAARLAEDDGQVFLRWYAVKINNGWVGLENLFLLSAISKEGRAVAVRSAGTLERNEDGYQRILFNGSTLVRIKGGDRRGLVVPHSKLKPGETGVPAGLIKKLESGHGPDRLADRRAGDALFLAQLEDMMAAPRQLLEFPADFEACAAKRSRDVRTLAPRTTGALVAALRDTGMYDEKEPLSQGFYRCAERLGGVDEAGTWVPFKYACGGGATCISTDIMQKTYRVSLKEVDYKSDLLRICLAKTIGGELEG